MAPRVLIVLPTTSYRAGAFLDAARRLGVEVLVGSDEGSSLGHLMEGRELVVDLGRPGQAADRAAALASRRPIDAVVGVDEAAVVTAAHVAARLGLRHSPVEAVMATRDKRRLRRRLAAAGVPQPAWAEAEAGDGGASAVAAAGRTGYPCVLKPCDLSASRGVIRADGEHALRAAAERVTALLRRPELCGAGARPPLLVEEFVAGRELAVEGLVDGGRMSVLALFDKPDPLDGPFFEETLLVSPSRLDRATRKRAVEVAGAAVAALGLSDGPVHAELRAGQDGVRCIEVAARTIGGRCAGALRFEGGAALEELVLRQALGLPLGGLRLADPAVGALMLPIARSGVLRAVHGTGEARRLAGVVEVSISIPAGQPLEPLPEGGRYLGFVLARGGSAAAVERTLRRAGEVVRAEIDDGDPRAGHAVEPVP